MKLLLALVLSATAGCVAIEENEARQQRIWLEKAGFQVTARQPTNTQNLPESRFREVIHKDGTVTFYYVDPTTGTVYAGGPQALAAYREISVRDRARRAANLARITPGSSRIRGPMVW